MKGGLYAYVPPSGGSLEIGNGLGRDPETLSLEAVPPSGGSLEIGNSHLGPCQRRSCSRLRTRVPPSGGSLEIGNASRVKEPSSAWMVTVPPSGGSLEIGNCW